jgi:hypothetical protein
MNFRIDVGYHGMVCSVQYKLVYWMSLLVIHMSAFCIPVHSTLFPGYSLFLDKKVFYYPSPYTRQFKFQNRWNKSCTVGLWSFTWWLEEQHLKG